MKITIVTVGTRGDVEPFVALGQGLQRAGHTVKIATHAMFESFVTQNGLQFALISGNVQEAINSAEARQALEKSKTTFAFLNQVRRKAAPLVLDAVKEISAACKDAEHLMCTPLTLHITFFLAKEFSIPLSVGCVSPAGPTRYFHNVVTPPPATWLPGFAKKVYNVATHVIIGKLVWMGQRPLLSSAWKEVFGHTLPLTEPLAPAFRKSPPLMLYAYSKYILPKPADWAPVQHVTGYWFWNSQQNWKPQPELEKFISDGSKPVYIGFGSMNSNQYKDGLVKKLIQDTLGQTGQRAVVLNAGLGLVQQDLPSSIFATDAVPFEYLFPKMAAVVHHGGAGTTAAGLRAGVPSVITPLIYDQRFWAWCVENAGAGTKPINWTELNANNLSAAINTALTNKDIINKAWDIGNKIRSENGVEEAVKLFNAFYAR
jgi:UDP:flavonoid glycosyltransferase YjiC (YdhE family)